LAEGLNLSMVIGLFGAVLRAEQQIVARGVQDCRLPWRAGLARLFLVIVRCERFEAGALGVSCPFWLVREASPGPRRGLALALEGDRCEGLGVGDVWRE